MAGQRPNLQAIQGPEYFVLFAKTWVEKCWDGEPEHRPMFGGEIFASVFIIHVNNPNNTNTALYKQNSAKGA